MRRLARSTAVRLAVGYAALFILSSSALMGLLWWQTVGYVDGEINAVIASDTRAIGDRLRDFGLPGAIQTIRDRVAANPDKQAIYLLADPFLKPLAGNVDAWPLKIDRTLGWHEVELVYDGQLHAARLLHVGLPGGFQLIVGRDIQDRMAMQEMLLRTGLWAAATVLLLAVLGGLLVRRAVLRRVEGINRTAVGIVQGDLGQRVEVRGTDDEFDQLAQTINRMLEQIQQLVEGVRNVSNTIAHDLRTPLAELRARLEGLLRNPPEREQALDTITEAVADIDRLIGVFNALLRLAEIDAGTRRAGFARVELGPLLGEMAELYGPIAEAKALALDAEAASDLTVDGDPYLLAQALGNLVDNAVKYTPAGGRVVVAAGQDAAGCPTITVADTGPGIAEADRGRVTARFYRGDSARTTAGAGLGLSLVEAIVRLHGGSLEFSDNNPGLRVTIRLPQAAVRA